MISKLAHFFGFGMSREDLDGQTIAELSEENLYLRDLFEHIRSNSLPNGDGGWGFDSGGRGDEPEVVAAKVDRMFLAWRDSWGAFERLLTVEDERDSLAEQNGVLAGEVARLKAEVVLPVELGEGYVPQLAIEQRKPRVWYRWVDVPNGVVVKDSDGDSLKRVGSDVFYHSEYYVKWYLWDEVFDDWMPEAFAPFTEVLPRTFQRGDVIPDDVTKLRLAGETNAVERTEGGGFAYNPDLLSEGWGPSDTSSEGWEDDDFPLTEVLN